MNWPAGYVVRLDGENIDGQDNDLVATGQDAYSWVNTGSFSEKFARNAVPSTPLIKKLTGSSVVSFDGRDDILTCPGSAAALGFLHQAGTPGPGPMFDIAFTIRRMATRNVSACRFFGTEGKGLGAYFTGYQAGTSIEGGLQFFLSNGTDEISTLLTQKLYAPIGEVFSAFVRGDGTKLRVTKDGWDWEEQTYLQGAGTGSAAHDFGVGSTGGNPASVDDYSCFDLFDFLIWPRNLSDLELDEVLANFATRSACR